MALSTSQKKLLARIKRCPKGCYIEPGERRTSEKLHALGLIDLNPGGTIAWPKEGK